MLNEKYFIKATKIHSNYIHTILYWRNYIITGSSDQTIKIYNKEVTNLIKCINLENIIKSLCIIKKFLVVGVVSGKLIIYNLDNNFELNNNIFLDHYIFSLVDNKNDLIIGTNKYINIYSFPEINLKLKIKNCTSWVTTLVVYKNRLYAGSNDKTISCYNIINNYEYIISIIHTNGISKFFSFDNYLLIKEYFSNFINIYDISNNIIKSKFNFKFENSISFCLVDDKLVYGDNQGSLHLYKLGIFKDLGYNKNNKLIKSFSINFKNTVMKKLVENISIKNKKKQKEDNEKSELMELLDKKLLSLKSDINNEFKKSLKNLESNLINKINNICNNNILNKIDEQNEKIIKNLETLSIYKNLKATNFSNEKKEFNNKILKIDDKINNIVNHLNLLVDNFIKIKKNNDSLKTKFNNFKLNEPINNYDLKNKLSLIEKNSKVTSNELFIKFQNWEKDLNFKIEKNPTLYNNEIIKIKKSLKSFKFSIINKFNEFSNLKKSNSLSNLDNKFTKKKNQLSWISLNKEKTKELNKKKLNLFND